MGIRDSLEPASCKNMEDIRAEIDCLDLKIISLLGKRFQYVQAASTGQTHLNCSKIKRFFSVFVR